MPAKTERQLALPIDSADVAPKVARARRIAAILTGSPDPPPQIDQILSTRQVLQITGKHRVTIYRWIRAGIFPKKHDAHGHKVGWLRSEIENWLAHDRGSPGPPERAKEIGATREGRAG
jgi:prophage regulatory protein